MIERRAYEKEGDVILVCGAVVTGVGGSARNQAVLLKTAINGQAVFTGDDTQVVDVGSVMLHTFISLHIPIHENKRKQKIKMGYSLIAYPAMQ